jgi:signal transduction histidine kinase
LNDILVETAESVKRLTIELQSPDLKVTLDLDKKIEFMNLDASQLKMALLNLCKNGVEALVEHKIPDAAIKISSAVRDGHAVLEIRDNGPGMPTEIANNLFVAFKTKKEGGTGLGLAITKKIIDVHGGTIECDTDNRGTTFTITL